MIILQVEDYCHNGCRYFTPLIIPPNIINLKNPFINKDTIIVCTNRNQCAFARSGLEYDEAVLKKFNEKYGRNKEEK